MSDTVFPKVGTFNFEDLVGRVVGIQSFRDNNTKLIVAKDLKSKEYFVLKEVKLKGAGQHDE